MSIAEYEFECSRAELLGSPRPTWEEFIEKQKNVPPICDDADENVSESNDLETDAAEDLDLQKETFRRTGGGLDELNTILANTQHKINKFKTVCGSFTNLMKLRRWKSEAGANNPETATSSLPATPQKQIDHGAKGDIEAELASQVDRLDSLINKAERADISMSVQNKQIRNILNK